MDSFFLRLLSSSFSDEDHYTSAIDPEGSVSPLVSDEYDDEFIDRFTVISIS
jgi:hypothetical protein